MGLIIKEHKSKNKGKQLIKKVKLIITEHYSLFCHNIPVMANNQQHVRSDVQKSISTDMPKLLMNLHF